MRFKIKKIKPLRLWHVTFDKQTDMTLTFLRLQEYCESPKFKGKYFHLDEYIQWYSEKYKKPFDYHLDVGAHNIPGHMFDEFMVMHEDYRDSTLSRKEEQVLSLIQEHVASDGDDPCTDEPYYVIATCKSLPDHKGYFDHEFRHGLFYLLDDYRRDILTVLKKYITNRNVKKFRNALSKDYDKKVLNDEVHAYALTSYNPYNQSKISKLPKGLAALRKDLKKIEKKYYKNGKVV